jgi:UDP-N-acetylglucosamine 2-epimerase
MLRADLILTDSGGIQEEATTLGKPLLVLRETTERQEAVEAGRAELVGADRELIVRRALDRLDHPVRATVCDLFGDGQACRRVREAMLRAPELVRARRAA